MSDEEKVIEFIRERLERGRQSYGDLDIDNYPRDEAHEALEEALDQAVYCAIGLMRRSKRYLVGWRAYNSSGTTELMSLDAARRCRRLFGHRIMRVYRVRK